MIKTILVSILCLSFNQVMAGSYELYVEGKMLESNSLLSEELNNSKIYFSSSQLSAAMRRLFDAYQAKLEVTDQIVVDMLTRIKKQKNSKDMEDEIDDYLKAFDFFSTKGPTNRPIKGSIKNVNYEDAEQYLQSAISNRDLPNRYAIFTVVKMYSNRKHLQLDTKDQNNRWLYLAGVAGFYDYNNGLNDLGEFIDACKNNRSPFCKSHINQATELYKIGSDIKL